MIEKFLITQAPLVLCIKKKKNNDWRSESWLTNSVTRNSLPLDFCGGKKPIAMHSGKDLHQELNLDGEVCSGQSDRSLQVACRF